MLGILKKRVDFLGVFQNCVLYRKKTVITQMCLTEFDVEKWDDDDSPVFVGITASRKVGNAVRRNRAKRRLRAYSQRVLFHEISFSQEFLQTLNLKKLTLSKKTLNVFFNKLNVKQKNITDNKKLGLVIVFIATKYTPDVKWNLLVTDVRDAMNRCLSNSIAKKNKFYSNVNTEYIDSDKSFKEKESIVRIPFPSVITDLELRIKNEKTFVFRNKVQNFLKKITYFTTDNK